ncbi:hypothetical protein [Rhodococcus koreensis]|uniref:hypothetical protein n=1 Tax=Rhodococcus koreensis TaxID=99653 RepID=UPI0036DD66BF
MPSTKLDPTVGERDVVFEIETDRGMYVGRSDTVGDTAHLLPRGMRFEVISAGEGRYRGLGREHRPADDRAAAGHHGGMRGTRMGLFTDDKGRPELVVHPYIKLGRAHFRPVDEQPESEPEATPKQGDSHLGP